MSDEHPDPARTALSAATSVVVVLAVLVLGLTAVGIVAFLRDSGLSGAVLLAVLLWALTAALAACAFVALREWMRGAVPVVGGGHLLAIRLVVVVATVVSGGVATWVSLDRATNISEEDLGVLLADAGDDLATADDVSVSLETVRQALAARRDGTTLSRVEERDEARDDDDPAFDGAEDPAGLTVLPVAGGAEGEVLYQVSDDDGGSPHCLVFTADPEIAGSSVVSVEPGLC